MPAARAPPIHERHRPETTVLYAIVKEHLAAFLALAAERYAAPLPKYVVRAFTEYLRCGLLEHGFLRVHCDSCRKDRLVAFSCKKRGPCPSCAARVSPRALTFSARHTLGCSVIAAQNGSSSSSSGLS